MVELSKRLQAVADLVSPCRCIADVGCDHGYVPIYLMKTGRCETAIAMDVNQGPLLRAKEHIASYGLSIETRLSDGVLALEKGEVDAVIIAGMGGALTIHILTNGETIFRNVKEFILQPQSEIQKVRAYLCEHDYFIVEENMIYEDGKYYPMMRVVPGKSEHLDAVELRFGKRLLEAKHPILKTFLDKEYQKKAKIISALSQENKAHILARVDEIKQDMKEIEHALQRYHS